MAESEKYLGSDGADVARIKIDGDMDALSAPQLRAIFETTAQESTGEICLDISDVGFLDSSGIGAVLVLLRQLRSQDRKLQIVSVSGQPAGLLMHLKIHNIIPIQINH